MLVFFGIWGSGTLVSLLFLDGPAQFLVFVGSAWAAVWWVARREDDGSRWGDERAKRTGETQGG